MMEKSPLGVYMSIALSFYTLYLVLILLSMMFRPTSQDDVKGEVIVLFIVSMTWAISMPIFALGFIWYFLRGRSHTRDSHSTGVRLQQHKLMLYPATVEDQDRLETLTNNPKCPICRNNIEELCWECRLPTDQDICMTSCKHIFHYACIKKAIWQNSLCPVCRRYQIAEYLRFFYRETQGKKGTGL